MSWDGLVLALFGLGAVAFGFYYYRKRRDMFQKTLVLKTFYTLGWLALFLIALVAIAVLILKS